MSSSGKYSQLLNYYLKNKYSKKKKKKTEIKKKKKKKRKKETEIQVTQCAQGTNANGLLCNDNVVSYLIFHCLLTKRLSHIYSSCKILTVNLKIRVNSISYKIC